MKLQELSPKWLRISKRATRWRYKTVDSIAEADGIMFLCPVCFVANRGSRGTHVVICWRPQVSQNETPRPGRWEFQGSGFADLTLVAGSSSVQLKGGCNAHFFVRAGEIVGA